MSAVCIKLSVWNTALKISEIWWLKIVTFGSAKKSSGIARAKDFSYECENTVNRYDWNFIWGKGKLSQQSQVW